VAERRLKAAENLLKSKHWDSAYYLAGYAVECGLKACIARNVRRHDFPDRKTVNDSYTHDLERLVKTAGLERALKEVFGISKRLEVNWGLVKDWSEDSRYERRTEADAKAIIAAIADSQNGVMPWITQYW